MAMFVHLAPLDVAARLRRVGIALPRSRSGSPPVGVFAVPVTPNFFLSHQWLRELKRRGRGPIAGVYFRIPDEQDVWVGHYGQVHDCCTAAEAVAHFLGDERREGWEVIVPRAVTAKEIHRVRTVPQVVGWRYAPGANGKPPFCTCRYCIGGSYGAASLRRRRPQPGEA